VSVGANGPGVSVGEQIRTRRRRRGALLLAVLAVVAAGGCDALNGHRTQGEKLYNEHCSNCHGIDAAGDTAQGMGNTYADLRDDNWKFGGDDRSIAQVIRDGSFGLMPAFRDKLSEEQIQSIIRHLRKLRGERAPETVR
jgi:cytochrome c oxidase cbb3-type subunit 3